jgi:tetratricopeptide (TPR) repeat protein
VPTSLPTTVPTHRKRRLLVLSAVLLLAGAGAAGYFAWRPRPTPVPPIRTEGLDAEVVAAIDEARAGVVAQPRSAGTWGHLGMVLFAQDMYADCIPVLAEAERLNPRDARWPYFRGLALSLEKPEEGIVLLQRAATLQPRPFHVRLRLAEEYLKLDRIDEAEALFDALLAEQPNDPRALLGRGQIVSRRGRWQEAVAPLQAAAEEPTARRSARVALTEAYARLGKAEEAAVERKLAAETRDDLAWPDPYLAAARALRTGLQPRLLEAGHLRDEGQIDRAAALVAEVLRDHPESDEAHLMMARLLIRASRFDDAEVELLKAITLNPDLAEGHFLMAGAQMRRKDYPTAERGYQRATALKPTYAIAYYNLGDCRLRQGNRAGAIEAFRDAVRYRPDLAAAHLELGALLLQDGHVEEAVSHLEQAVRLDEKSDRARTLLQAARAKKKP